MRKDAFVESEEQVPFPGLWLLVFPFPAARHELKSLLVGDLGDDFSDVFYHSTCVLSSVIYQSPYLTTRLESKDF